MPIFGQKHPRLGIAADHVTAGVASKLPAINALNKNQSNDSL
jgi:hypothetical protein